MPLFDGVPRAVDLPLVELKKLRPLRAIHHDLPPDADASRRRGGEKKSDGDRCDPPVPSRPTPEKSAQGEPHGIIEAVLECIDLRLEIPNGVELVWSAPVEGPARYS